MSFFESLKERARRNPKIIVLPESITNNIAINDVMRIIKEEGTALPVRLSEDVIYGSGKLEDFLNAFAEERGSSIDVAKRMVEMIGEDLFFAAMMVKQGYAHGIIAGKVYESKNVMMVTKGIFGEQEGRIRSSVFFREPPVGYSVFDLLAIGDMVANQAPEAEELYRIIVTCAEAYEALVGKEPKIALIAYFTGKIKPIQEQRDPELTKIKEALRLYKEGNHKWVIGIAQPDAALFPEVAKMKGCKEFAEKRADLFIASNLMAGNISYKLIERLIIGGDSMIFTCGLNYPAGDLSRGDSQRNIANVVAAYSVQAQRFEAEGKYKTIDSYFLNPQ